MVKWYERGEIGERLRDVLDFFDDETFAEEARKLGLDDEDIAEILLKEEEYA
jgi:hypothetical protein